MNKWGENIKDVIIAIITIGLSVLVFGWLFVSLYLALTII